MPGANLPLTRGAALAIASGKGWPTSREAAIRAFMRLPDGTPITQAQLARMTGINVNTIMRLMQGWNRPLLSTGLRIARELQKSPWEVLAFSNHVRSIPRTLSRAQQALKVRKIPAWQTAIWTERRQYRERQRVLAGRE